MANENSLNDMTRYRYVFFGRVQGVGFRWRARMAADELGLTGWVRNEWDGSVVMEVQGPERLIGKMLAMINSVRYIRISDLDQQVLPVVPGEKGFRVSGYS